MKRLLKTLIMICLPVLVLAQAKPDYKRTLTRQVVSDMASKAQEVLIVPHGSNPVAPSYVPDSNKTSNIYHDIAEQALYLGGIKYADTVKKIALTQKGAANGVATLDNAGTVPLSQLPADIANAPTLYEKLANKSIDTLLGNSNVLYPTQKAVKSYADSAFNKSAPDIANRVLIDTSLPTVFGIDSYTLGSYATLPARSYVNIVANTMRLSSVINRGNSGLGVVYGVQINHAYSPVVNTNTQNTSTMMGFNDIYHNAPDPRVLTQISNAYRSFLAGSFLGSAVAANDASITYTGTWATINSQTFGGKSNWMSGGSAMISTTSGATASYTFTGNSIVFGTSMSDGTRVLDSFAITIDGNLINSYNFNNNMPADASDPAPLDGHNGPSALIFNNLGPGSHTIVVTKASTSGASLIVDYFGTLQSPQLCAPVIVMEIPHFSSGGISMAAADYGHAIVTNGFVDTCNFKIYNIVKKIFQGYPIGYVKTNDFYNANTDYGTNALHPSDRGYTHLAEAWLSAVSLNPFAKVSAVTNIGTIDSETASANGANISGNNLILQSASSTRPGLVNNTTQTFSGPKTLSASVTASAGLAAGTKLNNSVTAVANSDVLVGADFNNSFFPGSFTGTRSLEFRTGLGAQVNRLNTGTFYEGAIRGTTFGTGFEMRGSGAIYNPANSSYDLQFGFDGTSAVPFVQGNRETVGYQDLQLQPLGGSLLVGGTTNNGSGAKLQVTGNISVSGLSTAGIVHNAANGLFSSSLISTADISNSAVDLTTKVTGVLPVGNGGTGSSNLYGTAHSWTVTQSFANVNLVSGSFGGVLVAGTLTANRTYTFPDQGGFVEMADKISNVSSSASLTLTASGWYVFSGTTAIWTLSGIPSAVPGRTYHIKNRGSGNLVINSFAGGSDIYSSSAVSTFTLTPGQSCMLNNDGTYYNVQ